MFVRIHFDAASLFPAMVMTSIAVMLNVYVPLEDNLSAALDRALYYNV